MGQVTNNPECQQITTDKPLKKTTFFLFLDRATVWKTGERYMYLLKQITCMIPNSPLIDFTLLHYATTEDPMLAAQINWEKVNELIYGEGYERESLTHGFCDRLRKHLEYHRTTMRQYLTPIENIQFIVPIIADATDADQCSMVGVLNEFFKDYPEKSELHFNGIYIQGEVSDSETRSNSSIFMEIPDITVIESDKKSMVEPPSTYTRKVKSIVDDIAAFINSKVFVQDDVTTTAIPNGIDGNMTMVNAALVEEDDNSYQLLVILILILIICALVMIITMICCWAFMCTDSKKKKKESKTRSASKENMLASKDGTGKTPKKGSKQVTPPRVSLSGMDSIDEFYIEPSADNTRTPQTKTPVTVTPQLGNTPKKPGYEDLDLSDRKNEDVEQQGGRRKGGHRNQKPPADFVVE